MWKKTQKTRKEEGMEEGLGGRREMNEEMMRGEDMSGDGWVDGWNTGWWKESLLTG